MEKHDSFVITEKTQLFFITAASLEIFLSSTFLQSFMPACVSSEVVFSSTKTAAITSGPKKSPLPDSSVPAWQTGMSKPARAGAPVCTGEPPQSFCISAAG